MVKKLLSITLVMCLLVSLSLNMVYAEANTERAGASKISIEKMEGIVLKAGEEINAKSKLNFDAQLANAAITEKNGSIEITGHLIYGNTSVDVSASGLLYPVKGGGVYDGKLVLGELKSDTALNIAQFRVENESRAIALLRPNLHMKGKTVLTITFENTTTNDVIYIQGAISSKDFYTMLEGAENQVKARTDISREDLDKKILHLSNVNNFLSKEIKSDESKKLEVSHEEKAEDISNQDSTVQIAGASVSYSSLNSLLNDLKTYGTVTLSDYSVPASIFDTDGWSSYYNSSTSPRFFYHTYGSQNSFYTMTQITMADVFVGWQNPLGYYQQVEVKHGLVVEYDRELDELSVFYYDFGLSLYDMKLSNSRLTDENVFINRTISGVLTSNPSYAKGAMALVPYLSTALSVWDYITATETQELNTIKAFDPTYDEQLLRYGDSVIRGVVGDFSDYYLLDEGQYAYVDGEIYSPTGYATLYWGYSYTAYTNL